MGRSQDDVEGIIVLCVCRRLDEPEGTLVVVREVQRLPVQQLDRCPSPVLHTQANLHGPGAAKRSLPPALGFHAVQETFGRVPPQHQIS